MFKNKRLLRNASLDIIGEGIWGLQAGMVPPITVFTILLNHYKAGKIIIGMISAIQGGLWFLPQLLGLFLFTSLKKRRRQLVLWHVIMVVPFQLLCGFLVFMDKILDPFWLRWGLTFLLAMFYFSMGIIVGVWCEWLAHLFDRNVRATIMGLAFSIGSLLSAAGGIISGICVEHYKGTEIYGWLLVAGSIIAWISMLVFWFIDDPAEHQTDVIDKPKIKNILAKFKESLNNWNFRSFLIGRVLVSVGLCISPFLAIYYQSEKGGLIPESFIVKSGAAMTIGTAITTVLIGIWGDKKGHRHPVITGGIIQVLTFLVILLGTGKESCLIAYFGIGACTAFSFITHTNMLYETCPHEDRLAHITVGNIVMTPPTLIAPLIAGMLASKYGLNLLFFLSLIISIIGAIWFILFVHEPRKLSSNFPSPK